MSVLKKLLQLQAATRKLQANADGQTGSAHYKYVSGNKLLGFVRPKMDELGLILTQEIVGITNTPITYNTQYGAKMEMYTSLRLRFTWIDSEDGSTLVNEFAANGMNAWDKGLGSALTYAERYYLMKLFHIATDEDDVDALIKPEAIDPTRQQEQTAAGVEYQLLQQMQQTPTQQPTVEQAIAEVNAARTVQELNAVWATYKAQFGQDVNFVKAIAASPINPRSGRSNRK